jgi:hypothetical protein
MAFLLFSYVSIIAHLNLFLHFLRRKRKRKSETWKMVMREVVVAVCGVGVATEFVPGKGLVLWVVECRTLGDGEAPRNRGLVEGREGMRQSEAGAKKMS